MKAKATARAERKATNPIDWKKRFKKTVTGKHYNGPEICNSYGGGFSTERVALHPMDFNRRTKAPRRMMITRMAPTHRPKSGPLPNMRTLAYPPPNLRTIAHPPPPMMRTLAYPMRMAAPIPNLRMPYFPSRMAPQYDVQPRGLSKTAFVQQNGKMAKKKKTGKCYVQ